MIGEFTSQNMLWYLILKTNNKRIWCQIDTLRCFNYTCLDRHFVMYAVETVGEFDCKLTNRNKPKNQITEKQNIDKTLLIFRKINDVNWLTMTSHNLKLQTLFQHSLLITFHYFIERGWGAKQQKGQKQIDFYQNIKFQQQKRMPMSLSKWYARIY